VIVTLDNHVSGAVTRVASKLGKDIPGLSLTIHAASNWCGSRSSSAHCIADIEKADIIIANMLFMEDHIRPGDARLDRASRDM